MSIGHVSPSPLRGFHKPYFTAKNKMGVWEYELALQFPYQITYIYAGGKQQIFRILNHNWKR